MPFSQIQPTLATTHVWSSSDMLSFDPYTATWSSGVVTVTQKNHGLATSDSVTISCLDATSAWNIGAKTVTKVDKDTFTFPLVADPGAFPNSSPYPVNYVQQRVTFKCASYSKTFYGATYIQIENLGGATNLKIQAKINDDAPWVDTSQNALTVGITKITDQLNFMRVTSGTGTAGSTVSVYIQK